MTDPVPGTLLSLGHGYTAQALARRLRPQGWRIIGTSRSPAHLAAMAAQGVETHAWPGADLAPLLARATHLLSSIAPGPEGDPVLAALPGPPVAPGLVWAGYLSTTAVYGDHGGAWVDEDTAVTPGTERGRWRAEAERQWQACGLPLHVFRLAGIYGPGRGPFAKVRDGTARRVVKPGQVFSRIHVEDIAQALAASMARPSPGAVWNLCDDDPAPPQDVIGHAARLLGLPLPPEEAYDPAAMTPMAASFYAENKRVRNDRVKRDLGLRLRFPTYREGLAALLAAETGGAAG
jgi:nucleoside-diphosphate-sugar epimerase